MKRKALYIGAGAGLVVLAMAVLQFVKARSESAGFQTRIEDLKSISLGIRGYMWESDDWFPDDIRDDSGRPLLSWRVAVLPYMELKSLYERFHLDEPWDSPHNIKLLTEMPAMYKGSQPAGSTATPYQRLVGADATFKPDRSNRLTGLYGPSDNTFHVVEAAELVPWTKPSDIAYSRNLPLPDFGFFSKPTFLAIMCSGSVFEIDPRRETEETIRNAIAMSNDAPAGTRTIQGLQPHRASFSTFIENPEPGVKLKMSFRDNW